jgi:hypothetical protein
MDDVTKIAVTVEQAEACDHNSDTFYVNGKAKGAQYLAHDDEQDEGATRQHCESRTRSREREKIFRIGGNFRNMTCLDRHQLSELR